MNRIENLAEWVPFGTKETFTADGDTPTEFHVRSAVSVAAFLRVDDEMILVGSGTDYTVRIMEPGPRTVVLVGNGEHFDGLGHIGAVRFAPKGEQRVVKEPHDLDSFTVIKVRVHESEEMRAVRRFMLEERMKTERALTEMRAERAKEREEAMFREPPDPDLQETDDEGKPDRAARRAASAAARQEGAPAPALQQQGGSDAEPREQTEPADKPAPEGKRTKRTGGDAPAQNPNGVE